MRVGAAVTTAILAISLAVNGGAAASADPGPAVPAGWELTRSGASFELTWHAPKPVPVGDSMVEFYAGERLLGRPTATPDQRSFSLAVDGVLAGRLTDLQVRASGRRLDAPVADPPSAGVASANVMAVLPPNAVDPGVPGSFSTISGEYALSDISLPGFAVPVEMRGFVVAPQGTSGSRPLVLFLHGRHTTCYQGTAEPILVWPCPSGYTVLPSHLGYVRAQQRLASQGYVTVSIAANGINAQDGTGFPPSDGGALARSSLVRTHLNRWADWAGSGRPSAPAIVRSAPVPDMTRVLLVGHSRGGDGVSRAALDSLTPLPSSQDGYQGTVRWTIRGLMLIGPTVNGHNPPPDVPSMTILPSCDGDISDLEGQLYLDATRGVSRGFALHSAVFVIGANHNYFNLEWTPGLSQAKSFDDYPSQNDPTCRSISPLRLTPDQQLAVGSTYAAAAAAVFVSGNDQVRPLIDGSGFRAPSVDPAVVLSHAVGANRTPFVVPSTSTVITGTGARLCAASVVSVAEPDGCHTSLSPHFAAFERVRPETGRYAIQLNWSTTGTRFGFRPASAVSLSNAQSVAVRLAVPASTTATQYQFQVAITDNASRRATLGTVTLDALPWPSQTSSGDWAQEIRVPMTAAVSAGLNLSQVTSLELVPLTASARPAWLIDAWGWRSGLPSPQPVALRRIDVGELSVPEGNSGTTTYQVPARVTGSTAGGQVRVFVVDPVTGLATASVVTVPSGATTISIPIQVTGNVQAGDGRTYMVAVKAISGVFIGDAYGQLQVVDDDA
jgi:hypothetical protein